MPLKQKADMQQGSTHVKVDFIMFGLMSHPNKKPDISTKNNGC